MPRFPWMQARRACVLTLLEAGRFAEWPTQIERGDALGGKIRNRTERDEFNFAGRVPVGFISNMRSLPIPGPIPWRAISSQRVDQMGRNGA